MPSVIINNVTYADVPSVKIPLSTDPTTKVDFYYTGDDTATASDVLSGKTLHSASGAVTGNIATKTSSNLSVSGATVTAPAGYYASNASASVASATQATPTISVNSSTGVITASATQTAGYVSAGTKSATEQMTVKAATTWTPTTSNQTIAAGTYLTGAQTILGDADLISANIKSGANIFGVSGATNVVDTTIASSGAASGNIMNGYKGYVNGSLVTGNLTVPSVSQDSTTKVLTIS